MTKLNYCKKCKEYTLKEKCPVCGLDTVNPIPPKYNPKDPYGKERRVYKRETQTNK